MIDGKATNAIVGHRNTHGCTLCPPYLGINKMLGPSFFHSRLNSVEWLMRNATEKAVPGNPAQTHPVVREVSRSKADVLEQHLKISINRPKIGGCENSNNGKMVHDLLNEPEEFAKTLDIDVDLVKTIRIALSSRKLKADREKNLYDSFEKQMLRQFKFVKSLPPCIHKYKH